MWFLIPAAVYTLALLWCVMETKRSLGVKGKLLEKIPKEMLAKMPRPIQLPYDSAVSHVLRYAKVFHTQNLTTVISVMSDVLYHTIATAIQGLNRIGIRKEIRFSPYPEQQTEDGLSFVYTDSLFKTGKSEIAATVIKGDMSERYVDSATGTVLYAVEKKNAEVTVSTVRSTARAAGQPIHCEGCGMEVETSGELFICKYCGATYRADSYDWVTTGISTPMEEAGNEQVGNTRVMQPLMYAAMFGGPVLAVLGLFAGSSTFLQVLIILGTLYIFGFAFWYARFIRVQMEAYRQLETLDPLATANIVGARMTYLCKRLFLAHDHNPADMRTMMDAAAFESFAQAPHNGSFVLDVAGLGLPGKTTFYLRDGRQILDMNGTVFLLTLTPQRQVLMVKRPLHVVFYRNERTRYEAMLDMQAMRCSGCGMPLDLTAHSACKYCGIEYDVADFDWKVAWVDPGVFTTNAAEG